MMCMEISKKNNQEGFALLITIIVVSVVISIGLAVLDLSIKQVQLSTNAKDSGVAFYAANAGAECAKYWRRVESEKMVVGETISPQCFSATPDSNNRTQITTGIVGDGEVFQYNYEFTWGVDQRCTQINTLVIAADSGVTSLGVTTTNMTALLPGYPDATDHYCEPGAQCTVVSVQGYNKSCGGVGGYGTVQREVLLQF